MNQRLHDSESAKRAPVRLSSHTGILILLWFAGESFAQQGVSDIGTIVFSPTERAAIVASRKLDPAVAEAGGNVVTLSGVVSRGGQKGTAWINGRPVSEGEAVANVGTPAIEKGRIVIDGKSVRVRESLAVETGVRSDFVRGGEVSVRSGK